MMGSDVVTTHNPNKLEIPKDEFTGAFERKEKLFSFHESGFAEIL